MPFAAERWLVVSSGGSSRAWSICRLVEPAPYRWRTTCSPGDSFSWSMSGDRPISSSQYGTRTVVHRIAINHPNNLIGFGASIPGRRQLRCMRVLSVAHLDQEFLDDGWSARTRHSSPRVGVHTATAYDKGMRWTKVYDVDTACVPPAADSGRLEHTCTSCHRHLMPKLRQI